MSDKPIEPSHEQIVLDFDEYLMKNIPGFLDKDSITIVKEISNKWRELRNGYIEYLLKGFEELKQRGRGQAKGENKKRGGEEDA